MISDQKKLFSEALLCDSKPYVYVSMRWTSTKAYEQCPEALGRREVCCSVRFILARWPTPPPVMLVPMIAVPSGSSS